MLNIYRKHHDEIDGHSWIHTLLNYLHKHEKDFRLKTDHLQLQVSRTHMRVLGGCINPKKQNEWMLHLERNGRGSDFGSIPQQVTKISGFVASDEIDNLRQNRINLAKVWKVTSNYQNRRIQ